MILIVIGVIVGIFGLYTMSEGDIGENAEEMLLGVILIILCFICIRGGMFKALDGYTEWELASKTEVYTMDNNNLEEENIISFKDIEDNMSIEIIQSENYENPVLYEYTRSGKKTIWTFAINTQETKYILYVPVKKEQENIDLDKK